MTCNKCSKNLNPHNRSGLCKNCFRFKAPYKIVDTGFSTPCWRWQLQVTNAGYGRKSIRVDGIVHKKVSAHRWYYEIYKGPIPEGLVIDHLCSIRTCVNPDHLEAVTQGENQKRTYLRGRR